MARTNLPFLLRGYLFLGTVILIGLGVIYTTHQINRLNRQSQTVATLFAQFSALATFTALDNPEVKKIFDEVVKPADFPMILTDIEGRPFVWKLPHAPVQLDSVDIETIALMDPGHPPPDGPIHKLFQIRDRFAKQNPRIEIRRPGRSEPFGYVYYGESSLARELRILPFVQIGGILLFLTLALVGYRSIKTSEQRAIWIGLAKETAHQLGTPISSLLGWVELMRERQFESPEDAGAISIEREFFDEVLNEMEGDAERLEKVANRFGQVGSAPKLEIVDIAPIVSEAVRYFRRRLPHLGKDVDIRERYDLVPPVSINKELIEWVVENVLKNAVDASEGDRGSIEVDVLYRKDVESVLVRVTDKGRGMTPPEAKRVFTPGYTTKQRGWGLGLTLAQRIVEDYHGGKIWVEKSAPGRGTTMAISFPT
ncbi:MAG: HAMP domain-containing histidine kinase [Candidatus Eisenbacteria bacterium]|uniref:histidine kinase n=1 Tax=Eiseniibacteriota bacterium TaxID=2212470 RepID=A0A956RQF6_UNCEI|nr:HAMP domain-containing histidine kinase [Candidatus Eisenbacteria bacterium]